MKASLIRVFSENSDFQYLETLKRSRAKRNKAGEFFVEGTRSIKQALQNGWTINALAYTRQKRLSDWAEEVIQTGGAKRLYELPLSLMEKLSDKEETSELLALAATPPDRLERIPTGELMRVVVFDRPASPGNLGAVIRSCDALRAGGLIVSGHAADLYDPETIRAASGSFFCIPCVRLPSHRELLPWLDGLKQRYERLQVAGTSAKASLPIQDYDFKRPVVLLVGNETHGLSENYKALCDVLLTIPMYGSASSFNVACAASILLYEADRQRR